MGCTIEDKSLYKQSLIRGYTAEKAFEDDPLKFCLQADSLVAIGLNCTPPRFVPDLLKSASAVLGDRKDPPLLVAYPNSGEGWVNKTGKWDGNADLQGCDLGAAGKEWVEAGARLVGGCCRTTPEYITSLAEALSWGKWPVCVSVSLCNMCESRLMIHPAIGLENTWNL